MKPGDTNDLWQDIVCATAGLGPDATALRIPLWVALQGPQPTGRRQAKDILKAAIQVSPVRRTTRLATKPNPGLLFCFPFSTPSNMNNLLPVAREARRRGLLGGIVTGGDFSSHLTEFAGEIPVISIKQLVADLPLKERARNLKEFFRTYRGLLDAFAERRPKLASSLMANRGAFIRALADSVQCGAIFKRLLEKCSPSAIVSSSDFWSFEHQLCGHAASHGIPSFVIQHGTIGDFWWPFIADCYCVWGETDFDEMRRLGAPPERLAILGMPATDKIFVQSGTTQYDEQKKRSNPVCLILSHTHGSNFEPEIFEQFSQFFAQAVHTMPAVTWKVKLHPAEDDSFYRKMGSAVFERLVFHPKQISLQEAVADADVATTVYSTSGLEAMIMDRPLIVAPLMPRVREFAPWPVTGGGTYASSTQEFQTQFNRLVSDRDYWNAQMGKQRTFLARHFANRGHAAECVADFLESYPDRRSADPAAKVSVGTLTAR
jgi:hypothetical protein